MIDTGAGPGSLFNHQKQYYEANNPLSNNWCIHIFLFFQRQHIVRSQLTKRPSFQPTLNPGGDRKCPVRCKTRYKGKKLNIFYLIAEHLRKVFRGYPVFTAKPVNSGGQRKDIIPEQAEQWINQIALPNQHGTARLYHT